MVSPGLNFHVGESLQTLCEAFAEQLHQPSEDVLDPIWTVLPSSALRQWLDANLSLAPTPSSIDDGITANLRYLFPTELVRNVEQLALHANGQSWTDWSTEALTLRILRLQSQTTHGVDFSKARSQAESIDEIARWRPELFCDLHNQLVTGEIRNVIEALGLVNDGPTIQSRQVREILASSLPIDLPPRLVIFGLANVPGGEGFTSLIAALSSRCAVDLFVPAPSVAAVRDRLETKREEHDDFSRLSWTREADEAFALWALLAPDKGRWHFLEPAHATSASLLDNLQQYVRGRSHDTAASLDASVQVIGCIGNARQSEQLRDALFEILGSGDVKPHEVLIVSPDLGCFEPLLDRYWNYPASTGGDDLRLPRLRYEVTEHSSPQLANRLGASIALLHLIGNYDTLEQMQHFLAFPSVARALKLEFEDLQRLWQLVRDGHLSFGVTARHREALNVSQHKLAVTGDVEAGTWERIVDRVALATLLPNESTWQELSDDSSLQKSRRVAGWPLGEATDASLLAKVAPLLRLLELEAPRRTSSVRQSLTTWLETLRDWMRELSLNDDDDSLEQALSRLDTLFTNSSENLAGISLSFTEFQQFWQSLDDQRTQTRVFGRGGVVVSDASSLPFAPYKVICIMGFDDDKIFPAPLPRPAMRERRLGDPDQRCALLGALLAATLCATERLIITWNDRSDETGRSIRPSIALDEFLDALQNVTHVTTSELISQGPRHAFVAAAGAPRVFDTRFRSLASMDLTTLADSSPRVHDATTVSLSQLRTFLRDPLAQFIRAGLQSTVPEQIEDDASYPRISPSTLMLYQLREQYVQRVSELLPDASSFHDINHDDHNFSRRATLLSNKMRSDERYAGDIPSLLWSSEFKTDLLNLFAFNEMHDASDFEPLESDDQSSTLFSVDGSPLSISTSLHDELNVQRDASWIWRDVEDSDVDGAPTHFCTRHVVPSPMTNSRLARNVLLYALDVTFLKAFFPDSRCSTMASFLPERVESYASAQGIVPSGEFQLNPAFVIRFEGTREDAVLSLSTLVGLYEQASVRPITLFRATNAAATLTGLFRNPNDFWASHDGERGDRTMTSSQMFFDVPFENLQELSPGEPFPFTSELTKIFGPLSFAKITPTKRPISQGFANLNSKYADRQTKSVVNFAPFISQNEAGRR